MKKLLAAICLAALTPFAFAEDGGALTIDAPSQVRLPLAGPNLELLTLRVNNIQVRAEWDVEGNDSADFSVDGGTLVLVSEVNSPTTKSAVVVVRDKFSYLNSSYTDLEAKATINIEFVSSAKMYILGGLATSERNDVWSSVDGATWEPLGNADWPARRDFAAVSHRGSIFVIGGRDNDTFFDDVWSSADGENWDMQGNAPWSASRCLRVVSHDDGLIYVSGGSNSGGVVNDVWSSGDGKSWTKRTGTTMFGARRGHEMASFDGAMFVMGGNAGANLRDVWKSGDNNNWVYWGNKWGGGNGVRRDFYAITHGGQMYIMGGARGTTLHKDVWSSSGGFTWGRKTNNPGWSARYGLGAASYKGKIYVIGGIDSTARKNDVWESGDNGVSWTRITPDAGASWVARYQHRIVVHTPPN